MGGPDGRSSRLFTTTCTRDGARAGLLQAARGSDDAFADMQASVISLTMHLSPAFAFLVAASTMLLNLRVFWRWVGPACGWRTACLRSFRDGRRRNGWCGCLVAGALDCSSRSGDQRDRAQRLILSRRFIFARDSRYRLLFPVARGSVDRRGIIYLSYSRNR